MRKTYGDLVAVDDVDLVVEKGHVYGALGPNGSGKSTTVRMLLGLAKPDKGEVRLFGQSLSENGPALLRRVGAVVETPAFVPYLSGRDNLRLLAKYTPGATPATIESTLSRVYLLSAAGRRFKNYSLGMKQRLGIAAAILNDPELIILDEPTNGLDPQGTREIRALIPELAAEGRSIVLCSHLLHEVEQVCDAVTIFQHGRVVAQGSTKELIGSRSHLELRLPDMAAAEPILASSPWAAQLKHENGAFFIEGAGTLGAEVNKYLVAHGQYASVIQPTQNSLEDVFFELTGDTSNG
ncbi:MAG: ABC transporter ATP-binding protein [Tepidiformaceae bacterium]